MDATKDDIKNAQFLLLELSNLTFTGNYQALYFGSYPNQLFVISLKNDGNPTTLSYAKSFIPLTTNISKNENYPEIASYDCSIMQVVAQGVNAGKTLLEFFNGNASGTASGNMKVTLYTASI